MDTVVFKRRKKDINKRCISHTYQPFHTDGMAFYKKVSGLVNLCAIKGLKIV